MIWHLRVITIEIWFDVAGFSARVRGVSSRHLAVFYYANKAARHGHNLAVIYDTLSMGEFLQAFNRPRDVQPLSNQLKTSLKSPLHISAVW